MYYTKHGSFPQFLPNRIRLLNGQTRTKPFTEDDILAAGYKPVDHPPNVEPWQKYEWSGSSWLVTDKSQHEIDEDWNKIRIERDKRIKDVEWRYDRFYRHQRLGLQQIDSLEKLDQYVQDLCDITKNLLPYDIKWPKYDNS